METVYRYIYKITLLCYPFTGHYYIGQHTTNDLNDWYAGSGAALQKYYTKFGRIEGQTYKKEIICFVTNKDSLNNAEYYIIGDKYKTDKRCMNLCPGPTPSVLDKSNTKYHKISKNEAESISRENIKLQKQLEDAKKELSKAYRYVRQEAALRQKAEQKLYELESKTSAKIEVDPQLLIIKYTYMLEHPNIFKGKQLKEAQKYIESINNPENNQI